MMALLVVVAEESLGCSYPDGVVIVFVDKVLCALGNGGQQAGGGKRKLSVVGKLCEGNIAATFVERPESAVVVGHHRSALVVGLHDVVMGFEPCVVDGQAFVGRGYNPSPGSFDEVVYFSGCSEKWSQFLLLFFFEFWFLGVNVFKIISS